MRGFDILGVLPTRLLEFQMLLQCVLHHFSPPLHTRRHSFKAVLVFEN